MTDALSDSNTWSVRLRGTSSVMECGVDLIGGDKWDGPRITLDENRSGSFFYCFGTVEGGG